MRLGKQQIDSLKRLMVSSAQKGNLANAGMALEGSTVLAQSESLVASNRDATDHAERLLVSTVCRKKDSNITSGLTMITVVEPCLMCLSACAQANYAEIAYIIPADKYVDRIPWMSDVHNLDKQQIASSFSKPIILTHLKEYEAEFCDIFEKAMSEFLR